MSSLLTSSTANTALSVLRATREQLDESQQRIATGLRVRSVGDQPSAFLVSQAVQSDALVTEALAEQFDLIRGGVDAALSGIDQIGAQLTEIQDALLVAASGFAEEAAQFAIDLARDAAIDAINGASFSGLNLLVDSIPRQIVSGFSGAGDSARFNFIDISGVGLGERTNPAAGATGPAPAPVPTTPEEFAAVANLPLLEIAYDPVLLSLLDLNGDGQYTTNAADDADLSAGGRQITDAARDRYILVHDRINTFLGTNVSINTLLPGGGNRFFLAGLIAPEFMIDVNGDGATNNSPFALPPNIGTFRDVNNRGEFLDIIIDDTLLQATRAIVDSITPPAPPAAVGPPPPPTFIELLESIDLTNGTTTKEGLELINQLRRELNFAATRLSQVETRLNDQAEFSSQLVFSLEQGVADLIEADLDEESARLQALLVQEALAVDALNIANARFDRFLTLFDRLVDQFGPLPGIGGNQGGATVSLAV